MQGIRLRRNYVCFAAAVGLAALGGEMLLAGRAAALPLTNPAASVAGTAADGTGTASPASPPTTSSPQAVTSTIQQAPQAMTSSIQQVPDAVTSTVRQAPQEVTSTVQQTRDAVIPAAQQVSRDLTSTVQPVGDAVTATIRQAPQAVTSAVHQAPHQVTSTFPPPPTGTDHWPPKASAPAAHNALPDAGAGVARGSVASSTPSPPTHPAGPSAGFEGPAPSLHLAARIPAAPSTLSSAIRAQLLDESSAILASLAGITTWSRMAPSPSSSLPFGPLPQGTPPGGPPGATGSPSVPLLLGFAALALGLLGGLPPGLRTRLRMPPAIGPLAAFVSPLERPG